MRGFPQKIKTLGSYLIGLVVYAGFVSAYFVLFLHFLDVWTKQVFDESKVLYAILALTLIIVQGVTLGILTSALLRLIRRKVR